MEIDSLENFVSQQIDAMEIAIKSKENTVCSAQSLADYTPPDYPQKD
jgi:hypothetical protein